MSEAHDIDRPSDPPSVRRGSRTERMAISALVMSVTVVLSLPAIFFALAAMARARRIGRPIPGTAIGAVAVSLVSLGMVVVSVFAFGYQRSLDKVRGFFHVQPVAVRDELTQRRYDSAIDKDTACKLVEQQLSQSGFAGNKPEDFVAAHCDGELVAAPEHARLNGVRAQFIANEVVVNGCLLRQPRWFVFGVTRRECVEPMDLPTSPPDAAPEAVVAAYEKKIRDTSEQARDSVADQTVGQKIAIVRNAAVGLGALAEKSCDKDDLKRLAGVEGIALETLDLGLFAPPNKPKPVDPVETFDAGIAPDGGTLRPIPWHWMNSERMRRLTSSDPNTRRKAAREFDEYQGSLLVVYRADSRDWPQFIPKWGPNHQYMYTKGVYDGWLIVFDLERGEPLCQAHLRFGNSDQVSASRLGLMGDTTDFGAMFDRDLHTNFQEKATEELKRIAPGLSLGYMATEAQ